MALLLSAVLFAGFFGNVVAGAYFGGPVIGDVPEMLLLAAAVVCFVVAILRRERGAPKAGDP